MNHRHRHTVRLLPVLGTLLAAVLLILYWLWLEKADGPAADIALALDARIPFRYSFAAFYLAWYGIAAVVLLILFIRSPGDHVRLSAELAGAALLFLLISALFPNTASIRPAINPEASVLADAVARIYRFDSPRNVLPGFHPFMVMAVTHACRRTRLRRLRAMYPLVLLMAVPGFLSPFFIKLLPAVSAGCALVMGFLLNTLTWNARFNDLTFDRL